MSDSTRVFSIVGKNLKLNTKADIQPHLDELEKIADLEEIHLGGNTLGVEACQALADVLKSKTTLKVADFADIFTGRLITEIPDALRALCDALINNTNLVELNLSDNAFGGRSAEPMVNFLKNNHSFSVLKLNNNGLGVTGGTIVAEALIEAAENLKAKGLESKLRTVICGRNRLENGSAPVWAKAYAAHGGLVEVRMFQNGIRMEGIEAISKGLASCPNLEVLDLQDNTATLRGSRAIAACLPKWPQLKTLNLSDCLLKPKGGALVFGALANGSNKALETIQVQYCDLDRKALDQLGSAIDLHLTSLTKLEINGNWADEEDECIEKIKNALAKHDHEDALDELDEMDPEGEEDEEDAEEEGEDETAEEEEDKEAPATAAAAKADETDELANALAQSKITDQQIEAVKTQDTTTEPATEAAQQTESTLADTEPVAVTQHDATYQNTAEKEAQSQTGADAAVVVDSVAAVAAADADADADADAPATDAVATETSAAETHVEPQVVDPVVAPAAVDATAASAPSAAVPTTAPGETVDLSDELYTKPAGTSADADAETKASAVPTAESPKTKKRGFRAAWSAIRELLK
ncbi:RNI-like protein [Testicularia cyperi]|uniref:RNI-like protein n=1 Tax=Testicularia cyperi TaxID=1882483 RepID=A0A317XYU1_9BASI|nr:RNI-like protein [Testicularia cyperi]